MSHLRITGSTLRRLAFLAAWITCLSLSEGRAQSTPDGINTTGPGGPSESTTRPPPRDPVEPDDTLDPALGGGLLPPPSGDNSSKLSQLLPIYFPAPAPVLDSELPAPPSVRDPVWAEIGPYINEPFLAPLSTRVSQGPLNRRLRQRLDAHKASANALLGDLRKHVYDPARQSSLHGLAERQAPRCQELVASADELRRELSHSRFLNRNPDWNEYRNWRLGSPVGKRSVQELLQDEHSVLRAAIYYQEGLSTQQRYLLREIAGELAETLGDRNNRVLTDSFEPPNIVYFLPHGSRIRLPEKIPTELDRELESFTKEKTALKRELREALFALDRSTEEKRERTLKELAIKQEPRFAALVTQAEQIRIKLAALPATPHPAVQPGMAPELVSRIEAYLREKSALQIAAQKQAQDQNPTTPDNKKPARRTGADRTALIDFENQNRARVAALSLEAAKIREEVANATTAHAGEAPSKSVDALLAEFMRAFKHQQLQAQYRDYRAAVLQPGLSPAQRQLLFDAALASLDLTGDKDWQAVPE